MSQFDFAAAIAARPSGATRGQLVAAYGDPTQGCTRTGKGCFEPSAAFRRNMVKIPLTDLPGFPGYAVPGTKISGITFHARVAPVFVATWAELHRRGLTGRLRTYDGAITYRHMLWNYDNPVSLHAYGAAIDFDARWNGYGIPHNQMQIDRDVVKCFEECGWEWGGRWGRSDGMHFQWTDPLPGVRQPEWRDAMARGAVKPAPPAVRVEDIPALPQGNVGRVWEPVYDDDTDQLIPGLWVSLRKNRKTGEGRIYRVSARKLKKKGLK